MQQGRAISWFLFQNMERRQVLSCNSLTECSKGELFHGFYFFLSMVLSLLISVMTLVLSWNSSTECSEGEVFHGFYVLIWKGVRIWKQARILKGGRSCHEIAWLNAARESNVMVSISFCLCPVRIWAGVRSSHEIAWLNTAMESYFIVFSFCLCLWSYYQ